MELLASRDEEDYVHVEVVVHLACRDYEVHVYVVVVVHLTSSLANMAEVHEQN